jgi:hypothetical protein
MIASPTIVTEIGKIADIALVELTTTGHRRKHRAKPLAITTGVTDLHHSGNLTGCVRIKQCLKIQPFRFDFIG